MCSILIPEQDFREGKYVEIFQSKSFSGHVLIISIYKLKYAKLV